MFIVVDATSVILGKVYFMYSKQKEGMGIHINLGIV